MRKSKSPYDQMTGTSVSRIYRGTRIQVYICVAGVFVACLMAVAWVFVSPIEQRYSGGIDSNADLTILLAPILIVVVVIERLVELLFRVLESNWKEAVAFFGYGLRRLRSAEDNVLEARQWLDDASRYHSDTLRFYREKLNEFYSPENNDKVSRNKNKARNAIDTLVKEAKEKVAIASENYADARRQLIQVEHELDRLTTAPGYRNFKIIGALVVSLLLGVTIATPLNLEAFAMLGVLIPARLDVLITGLVIGASALPAHSVINNLGDLAKRVIPGKLQE